MLTQAELKKLLSYNPETGLFTWLVAPSRRVRAGQVAGSNSDVYLRITISNRPYLAHRLVWLYVYGKLPNSDIDHINQVKKDNMLCNLREANESENGQNRGRPANNTSGYKGVSWNKDTNRWRVHCAVNGKNLYLGNFGRAEEASKVYKAFAALHFGGFYNSKENVE